MAIRPDTLPEGRRRPLYADSVSKVSARYLMPGLLSLLRMLAIIIGGSSFSSQYDLRDKGLCRSGERYFQNQRLLRCLPIFAVVVILS